MNTLRTIPSVILLLALSPVMAQAPPRIKLGENAALRYWSAFAQMQDLSISDEQAKELNLILEGTAPYSDLKYRDLVERNRPAFETMIRGTALPNCDWGMDYTLGSDTPVDFVRKGLTLGRLNVLYALHLLQNGDKDGAARALAAGLRFSHDLAAGGTLFASLVTKHLLVDHIRVIAFALHMGGLSPAQESLLRTAVSQLGPEGLDWRSNVKRELEMPQRLDGQSSAALARIIPDYLGVLDKPSTLPELEQMIGGAPEPLQKIIPAPQSVVEAKQDLSDKIQQILTLLQ